MIYFRPRFLLIDEPDSHLHPDIQERLVNRLVKAAREQECQVILTTHSPSVVRSLGDDTTLIWMKGGKVEIEDTDEVRKSMGWGLLDKSILLVTEDKKVGMLNSLISQWPDLSRKVAVWSARGSSKLPEPEVLSALHSLFSNKMKIVIHRDSDFMLSDDRGHQSQPYEARRLTVWFTDGSDLESIWNNKSAVAAHFKIEVTEAEDIINEACSRLNAAESRRTFNTKRVEISKFIKAYRQGDAAPIGTDDAYSRFLELGPTEVHLGKDLASKIREIADERKLPGVTSFGKVVPNGVELALSLKTVLNEAIQRTSA